MLWELFITFLIIGFVSVGGGYSMVPVIEHEAVSRGWMTSEAFSDIIAIAGAAPGPIATNSATMVGFQAAGVTGAVISAIGMTLPSLLLVILVGLMFAKFHQNRFVTGAFYILRPVVSALVLFAAYRLTISSGTVFGVNGSTLGFLLIFAAAFIALIRYRVHPLAVIVVSGLAGVAFYA